MRVPGAILSMAALFWGFYQAPFLHIHPEDLDHPPVSAPVHVHFHGVTAPGAFIDAHTADDDAIDLGWNPDRTPRAVFAYVFAISEPVALPSPAPSSAPLPIPQQRGHDPPGPPLRQSRAPPA